MHRSYLFMAQARCYVPSGGSFGRSISHVVEALGGTVLTGAISADRFTGDWFGPVYKRPWRAAASNPYERSPPTRPVSIW